VAVGDVGELADGAVPRAEEEVEVAPAVVEDLSHARTLSPDH